MGKRRSFSAQFKAKVALEALVGERLRAEHVERSFAHTYETGGMRRTHLRGHTNIYKRLCIHGGAFNLGLVMRKLTGKGTPRGLYGLASVFSTFADSGSGNWAM